MRYSKHVVAVQNVFITTYAYRWFPSAIINPRRACAARVTVVVVSVCLCVHR